MGYLAQHQDLESGSTIYQELLSVKQDVIDLEARIRALELEMKHLSGDALTAALEAYTRLNQEFEQKEWSHLCYQVCQHSWETSSLLARPVHRGLWNSPTSWLQMQAHRALSQKLCCF